MAKGNIGKTYEVLFKAALDELIDEKKITGKVFWNEKPENMRVVPDFFVGKTLAELDFGFLVTHCNSPKESNRKGWRNLSELCEAKVRLDSTPRIVSVLFDAKMKQGIIDIQEKAFDSQLLVEEEEYGPDLILWANKNKDSLPTDQDEKVMVVRERAKRDEQLARIISYLKADILKVKKQSENNSHYDSLWKMEKQREICNTKQSRITHLKRGLSKRLLIGDSLLKDNRVKKEDGKWLEFLGLVKKTTTGYVVCDEELHWFINSPYNVNYTDWVSKCMSEGFVQQMQKVKNLSLINLFGEYVTQHYMDLCSADKMQEFIESLFENPSYCLEIPDGVEGPNNIWIYDFIASLVKAKTGKNQGFGYSYFNMHELSNQKVGDSITIGGWCGRFAGEYFNRKSNLSVPDGAVHLMAVVLSEKLSEFSVEEITQLNDDILKKYRDSEFEATFLSHRGFTPLQQLLIESGLITNRQVSQSVRSCFAEQAQMTGQSGKLSVIKIKSTIIICKSATKNPHDKRKELYAQATGLRYSWDGEKFVNREGVKKLILFIDGTWNQEDLDILLEGGWDDIFYPDEIEELKAAIV